MTVQLDVVEVVHVIKRTDANATLAEGLVLDPHVRLFHVVEKNLNCALGGIAHQLHPMPGFIFPRRLVLFSVRAFRGAPFTIMICPLCGSGWAPRCT